MSDVLRLGPKHVTGDQITIRLHKNRNRSPVTLTLPILPELRAVLDASELGTETFLISEWGKAFASEKSLGNKFKDWCNRAGLPQHCTGHGVRKIAATILPNGRASSHALMAIFGWRTLRQAEVYTRAADQRRLAADAMPLLSSRQKATNSRT